MKNKHIKEQAEKILQHLCSYTELHSVVDDSYPIPEVFHGTGKIRLFILGQDPTVKNAQSRAHIKVVLNLDKPQSLKRYIEHICGYLDITLNEHIYATNYFKNFFTQPPTQIKKINIFEECRPYWLDLLKEELDHFPGVPVITLGEPLLTTVVRKPHSQKVRTYWGYVADWKTGGQGQFSSLEPEQTYLDRRIFPFPHQPSIHKQFYRERLAKYTAFVKTFMSYEGE